MSELGRSGKVASDLAGRSVPMANDVIYSLVELGVPVRELPKFHRELTDPQYGKRRITIGNPGVLPQPNPPQMLHVDGPTAPAKKRRIRSNIPDFYPDFPDPHTYIWTPVS
jgi:transcription initiation factor TFIID subunit 8